MKIRILATLGACVLTLPALVLPSHAQQSLSRAMTVTSCGGQGFPLGTAVNPIYEPLTMLANGNLCTNAAGGGGGSAADQTGTNATDGQAASTANQHALAFGYIYNGTTWDRIRGTGGAVNTAITSGSIGNTGFNALQAGANSSLTNPLFTQLSQGSAALSATNGLPTTDTNAAQSFTAPGTAAPKVQGVQGVAGGIAIPASEADGANTTLGSKADAPSAATGSTAMAIFRQLHADLLASTPASVTTTAPTYTTGTTQPLSLNTAGGLRVDGSGVTQPISATALPLPMGASTAANQNSTAAGTSAANAQAVQGVTGGVALPITIPGVSATAGLPTNQVQLASTTLGAPTAYGTAPTGPVAGVNANVTNTVAVAQQDGQQYTVSATSAAPLIGTGTNQTTGAISTTGYQSIGVQITANAAGVGYVFEQSNDGATFYQTPGSSSPNAGTSSPIATGSGVAAFSVPVSMSYFRIRAFGSGGAISAISTMKIAPVAWSGVYSTPSVGAAAGTPAFSAEAGSSTAAVGITPIVTAAGTSAVGKASQGNLYSAYAIATAANSAQAYLVVINATAAPASGTALTGALAPVDFAAFSGNAVGANASVNFGAGPPSAYSTGIVVLISTSLTTYTPAANAAINVRWR